MAHYSLFSTAEAAAHGSVLQAAALKKTGEKYSSLKVYTIVYNLK